MNPRDIDQRLRSDPAFAQLSYSDQLQVRQSLVSEALAQDPTFRTFDRFNQNYIAKELIFRPPVLADPQQQAEFDRREEALRQYQGTERPSMWSTDPQDIETILEIGRTATQAGGLARGTVQNNPIAHIALSMEKLFGVNSGLDYYTGRDADKIFEYYAMQAGEGKPVYQEIMSRVGMGEAIGFGMRIAALIKGGSMLSNPLAAGVDAGQAVARLTAQGLSTAGAVGTGSIVGTQTALQSLGFALGKASTGSQFGMWAARSFAPRVVDAIGSAFVGVGLDTINGISTDRPELIPNTFEKLAFSVGTSMAQELLFGYALRGVLKVARGALGGVFRAGSRIRAGAAIDPANVLEEAKRWSTIDTSGIPDAMVRSGDDMFQNMRFMDSALIDVGQKGVDDLNVNVINRAVLGANSLGARVAFRPLENGAFSYSRLETGVSTVLKSADDLYSQISHDAMDMLVRAKTPAIRKLMYNTISTQPSNWIFNEAATEYTRRLASVGVSLPPTATALDVADAINNLAKGTSIPLKIGVENVVGNRTIDQIKKATQSTPQNLVPVRVDGDAVGVQRLSNLQSSPQGNNAYALIHRAIDEGELGRLSEVIERVKRTSGLDDIAARNNVLRTRGYDGIRSPSGAVTVLSPDQIIRVDPRLDITAASLGKKAPVAAVSLKGAVEATIPRLEAAADSRLMANALDQATVGHITGVKRQALNKTLGLAAESMGLQQRVILETSQTGVIRNAQEVTRMASNAPGGSLVRVTPREVRIQVPTTIATPEAQINYVRRVLTDLKTTAASAAPNAASRLRPDQIANTLSTLDSRLLNPRFRFDGFENEWLRHAVTRSGGQVQTLANGQVQAIFKSGTVVTGNSLAELKQKIIHQSVRASTMQAEWGPLGFRFKQVGNQWQATGPGIERTTANSIGELAEKINYQPQRLSSAYAPRSVTITPDGVNIEFDQVVSVRTGANQTAMQKARQLLDSFEDPSIAVERTQLQSLNGATISQIPGSRFQVDMPGIGMNKPFDSLVEARRFVTNGWNDVDELRKVTADRGLRLFVERGQFKVSDGLNEYVGRDVTELREILKTLPDPTGAPGLLTGIDDSLQSMMDQRVATSGIEGFRLPVNSPWDMEVVADPKMRKPEWLTTLRRTMQDPTYDFERLTKELNQPEMLRTYRTFQQAIDMASIDEKFWVNRVEQVMRDGSGKPFRESVQRKIFYFKDAQNAEEILRLEKNFGKLTPDEARAIEGLNLLLGTTTDMGIKTGLAGVFNVDTYSLVNRYAPRIRADITRALGEGHSPSEFGSEFIGKLNLGQREADTLNEFFRNMRTSEMLAFVAEDNMTEVMRRYISIGMRAKYLNPVINQFNSFFNSPAGKSFPLEAKARLHQMIDLATGKYVIPGTDSMNRIASLLTRAGWDQGAPTAKQLASGQKLMQDLYALQAFVNIGFKPYSAIKNSMQIYSTLGARWGMADVLISRDEVAAQGAAIYQRYSNMGVYAEMPQWSEAVEGVGKNGWFGRLVRSSMGMFKNSDEYTRTVAFRTAERKLEQAIELQRRGQLTGSIEQIQQRFREISGLSQLEGHADDIIARVEDLVREGSPQSLNAATYLYGRKVVSETMFDYNKVFRPALYQSNVLGKWFGQYGTFAVGFRANIHRALQGKSLAQKALFVTRLGLLAGAAHVGTQATGLNMRDFNPMNQAMFGGGPWFSLATDAAQAMGSGFNSDQARARVMRALSPVLVSQQGWRLNIPQWLPGGPQLRMIGKAMQYAEEGDQFKAMASLFGTPTVD